MGRPKLHDARTRRELVSAAERLLARGGLDALTVRAVAEETGTTTRAVYTACGSKDGLVQALAERAFDVLTEGLSALPETNDPAADLVLAGADVYREFVADHPWLFRIAFQRLAPGLVVDPGFERARTASFGALEGKVRRVADAGLLHGRSVRVAAVEFNAMCEGLGNATVRGGTMAAEDAGQIRELWLAAFQTVVSGLTTAR